MNTELEEAASNYAPEPEEEYQYDNADYSLADIARAERRAFKAGAKWYAQQLINQLDEE